MLTRHVAGQLALCFRARHLRQHLAVAVAVDELDGQVEAQQARDRLAGHRARDHVAPDHDPVHLRPANVLQHRLQRGEVAVDVIDRRDSHDCPAQS
jgi:hypothetical protein